jgi:hypothetical protein
MAEAQSNRVPECRWTAVHKKCSQEAFGYALAKSHEDFLPWIGAIIYKRGSRPYKLTDERLAQGLTCYTCKAKIKTEDEITVAPEMFTVKSLIRFFEIYDEYVTALALYADKHIRILEYGAMLGINYDMWKGAQANHDAHVEHSQKVAEGFLNLCAILGECGSEPEKPSKLLRASGLTNLRKVARATGNADLTED